MNSELLGDLGEVGTANKADDGLLTDLLEESEHLRRSGLSPCHESAATAFAPVESSGYNASLHGGQASGCRRHLRVCGCHETVRIRLDCGQEESETEPTKEADDVATFTLSKRSNSSHI